MEGMGKKPDATFPPRQIHLRLVLLFMVAAHIAFFAAALVTVNSCMGFIVNIDKAGTGARDAVAACTDLRNLQVRVLAQLTSCQSLEYTLEPSTGFPLLAEQDARLQSI